MTGPSPTGRAEADRRVAGVDEVGRGPLAGPVVAAAVILDPLCPLPGLRDSKTLSALQRERLAGEIRAGALALSIGMAAVEEVDALNVLQATLLAMQRAVGGLVLTPELVLVDGNQVPALSCPARAVIRGDASVPSIAAASIVAKVTRDALMCELDRACPGYGFARHKGYPTAAHLEALRRLGVSAVHRRSFGPVAALLAPGGAVRP